MYHIDHDNKTILSEELGDDYINCDEYNDDNETSVTIKEHYRVILNAAANWHGSFWDNYKAFERVGLTWHFEAKENMLAWINDAMERPFKKYLKNEESGKIPKKGVLDGANNITQKELRYYEEALRFLKVEYIKLVDERFNVGENITVVHGDLHPGRIMFSESQERKVLFIEPQNIRMGLCTEDLAMLIALHFSCDSSAPEAIDFNDTQPLLDYYHQCLGEKVKDYSYETFINDYRISVAENLFFPIRLINQGIMDFRMRDKAINAFKIFAMPFLA